MCASTATSHNDHQSPSSWTNITHLPCKCSAAQIISTYVIGQSIQKVVTTDAASCSIVTCLAFPMVAFWKRATLRSRLNSQTWPKSEVCAIEASLRIMPQ
jgi:hypothetical protein